MITQVTRQQRRQYFALLKKKGLGKEEARQVLLSHTDGLSASVAWDSPITYGQMNSVLAYLRGLNGKEEVREQAAERMRKKVFSLCYQAGFIPRTDNPIEKKINQVKVYEVVRTLGYLKPKELNAYTASELPKLVTQFQQIVRNNARNQASKTVNELKNELNLWTRK